MIRLVAPDARHQQSYLAASDEFVASGEQRDGDGLWAEEGWPLPCARRRGSPAG